MNVLSLFDGISCGQIALERAGIKVDKYFASEIEQNAIKTTQHHFPNTIQLGSVVDVKASDLPPIDLLIGGSPCQDLSFVNNSGKKGLQLNSLGEYLKMKENGYKFSGSSFLFWEYLRLLKEVKPKYFLLENVRMLPKWQYFISRWLETEPVLIDSQLVSAQTRNRFYWSNWTIRKPTDRHLYFRHIKDPDETKYKMFADWKYQKLIKRLYAYKSCYKMIVKDAGKVPCVLSSNRESSGNMLKTFYKNGLRLLTPLELERAQTLPDGYTDLGFTNNQRIEMVGNGWTVDVIASIFKTMDDKPAVLF